MGLSGQGAEVVRTEPIAAVVMAVTEAIGAGVLVCATCSFRRSYKTTARCRRSAHGRCGCSALVNNDEPSCSGSVARKATCRKWNESVPIDPVPALRLSGATKHRHTMTLAATVGPERTSSAGSSFALDTAPSAAGRKFLGPRQIQAYETRQQRLQH
jgi:hypothetical protein